jgi:hypothetical protein
MEKTELTLEQAAEWIGRYFKDLDKLYVNVWADEFLEIHLIRDSFGQLVIQIENVELHYQLMLYAPMPETEEEFFTLMKVTRFYPF